MEDVWSVNHEEEDGEARRDVGVCDIVGVVHVTVDRSTFGSVWT